MKYIYIIILFIPIGMLISGIASAQKTTRVNPIISFENKSLPDQFNLNSVGESRFASSDAAHIKRITDALDSRIPVPEILYKSSINRQAYKKAMILHSMRAIRDTTIHLSDPGILSALLTDFEKATITALELTGIMDARDFKTLRDSMPVLASVDIRSVTIVEYTGTQGPASGNQNTFYPANAIPQKALSSIIDHFKLVSVLLPASITAIGDSAFYYCAAWTGELFIPPTVTSIGNSAFENCGHLTGTLTIPNSVVTIGKAAFAQCQGLTGLDISQSLDSIADRTFEVCWSLVGQVVIPDGVTYLGERAFSYCSSVTGFTIPQSANFIGKSAFSICKMLTGEIIIPSSVTAINDYTFARCARLTGITIPPSVTSIGDYAFTMSGLKSITLPNSVTSIGRAAFVMCNLTDSIVLPNSVTSLGTGAFALTGVTDFVVRDNHPVFSVKDGVLFNKTQTTLVMHPSARQGAYIIPNSVTKIGASAFYYCHLSQIQIPSSVDAIDSLVFEGCFELVSLYTYPPIPIDLSNSKEAFYGVSKTRCTLHVPTGSFALYHSADQWKDFVNIIEMSPTASNEFTDNNKLILYPNPLTKGFYINTGEESTLVSLYNLSGKQLLSRQFTGRGYVDMATLPQGLYIVKISTSDGTFEQKLVKK